MAGRDLSVDHVTIWRWVQRYAPILNQRIRREMRRPNRSWRVDETYVKVAGNWAYLYRAVDSAGETIEFMLSPKRFQAPLPIPDGRCGVTLVGDVDGDGRADFVCADRTLHLGNGDGTFQPSYILPAPTADPSYTWYTLLPALDGPGKAGLVASTGRTVYRLKFGR